MSLLSLGVTAKFNMGVARKLEEILQSLTLPEDQGRVFQFLTDTENAQRINELVEDIHKVVMDYQVCKLNHSSPLCLTFMPDIHTKRYPL